MSRSRKLKKGSRSQADHQRGLPPAGSETPVAAESEATAESAGTAPTSPAAGRAHDAVRDHEHAAAHRAPSPRNLGRRGVRTAAITIIVAGYLGVQALIFATGEKPIVDPGAEVAPSSVPMANAPPTTAQRVVTPRRKDDAEPSAAIAPGATTAPSAATEPTVTAEPRVTAEPKVTAAPKVTADPNEDYVPGGRIGPGLTRPAILVEVEPNAQGDLEVVERVLFATAQRDITVAPPAARGVAGAPAALTPRVRDLQVSADGELVSIPVGSAAITARRQLQLERSARTVILRYRVDGAASRSIPGPPGRALLLLPPISSSPTGSTLPVVVQLSGGHVLNLLCPALDVARQLCGQSVGPVWFTTQFDAGATAVLAQLDLPPPGA